MPVRHASHHPAHVLIALLLTAGCASHGSSKVAPAPAAGAAIARPVNHVAAGNDLMSRNLLDDAEREFRLALEVDPNDRGALAGLGRVSVLRGQYPDDAT